MAGKQQVLVSDRLLCVAAHSLVLLITIGDAYLYFLAPPSRVRPRPPPPGPTPSRAASHNPRTGGVESLAGICLSRLDGSLN